MSYYLKSNGRFCRVDQDSFITCDQNFSGADPFNKWETEEKGEYTIGLGGAACNVGDGSVWCNPGVNRENREQFTFERVGAHYTIRVDGIFCCLRDNLLKCDRATGSSNKCQFEIKKIADRNTSPDEIGAHNLTDV